jgi:hypothetical protein
MPILIDFGAFDCVVMRFAHGNSAQGDKEETQAVG